MLLTNHAQVSGVLGDTRFDVPAAPPGTDGLGWLRGAVSRFSRGQIHARRRRIAAAALATVDTARLRVEAARTAAQASRQPADVPLTVLARALGVARPVVDQVVLVTPGYFGRADPAPPSDVDAAVAELVEAFGGVRDEQTAARIGLLVQAHEATGRLVANTLAAIARWRPAAPIIAAIVAETLRHDPPVPMMRRECLVGHEVAAGTVVMLDVAAANRDATIFADPDRFDPMREGLDRALTFGAGLRPCPGRDHALALAIGTVEGVFSRG